MPRYYCEVEDWVGHHWRTFECSFPSDDAAVAHFLEAHSRRVLSVYYKEFRSVKNQYRGHPERTPVPTVVYKRPEYPDHPKPREVWKPPKPPPPLIELGCAGVKTLTWNEQRETGNERAAS